MSFESARALVTGSKHEASPVGVVLAVASLTVVPFLAWAQRRTGRAMHSGSVAADSNQTLLCTCMSAVLLVGVALNAVLGCWWADPHAGLAIAVIALKELSPAPPTADACCSGGTCSDGCC